MMMSIMNGLETDKRIQRMIDVVEISNNSKIIIVSAHIEENLLKELKNIKCIIENIQKTLKKSKLEELLNSYYFSKWKIKSSLIWSLFFILIIELKEKKGY